MKLRFFSLMTSLYAWCGAWSLTTLWLGMRQALRGKWQQPGCPRPMQLTMAWIVLLALVIFYVEFAKSLAKSIKTLDGTPPAEVEDGDDAG